MRRKDILGRRGEELAVRFLQETGMRILDRNWRCAAGEIDIVAVDGDVLVIVEVKTRSSSDFGHPLEAVTPPKVARLCMLGREWARRNGSDPARTRVDVLGVIDNGRSVPVVEYLRAVA